MDFDPSAPLHRSLALAVATLGFVALLVVGRALRGRRETGLLRPGDLSLCLALAGTVAFVAFVVPTFAREAFFVGVDVDWIASGIRRSLIVEDRIAAVREVAALYRLGADLDPARWAWAVLIMHFLNGALLFALARRLEVSARQAAVVALGFVANPAMVTSLAPSYVCEVGLLSAYLGVCIAYLERARAHTPRRALAWLFVEVLLFLIGCGNKESFLVYPALLVALEATVLYREPAAEGPWAHPVRRLAPHLVLFALGSVVLVPVMVRSNGSLSSLSLNPLDLLEQLLHLAGAAAAPPIFQVNRWWAGMAVLLFAALWTFRARGGSTVAVFGLAFFVVTSLPMLPLGMRLFPGYLYQPWAGLALCLLGAADRARAGERALVTVWMAGLLVSTPAVRTWPVGDYYAPVIEAVRALPQATCREPTPTWHIPAALFETFTSGDPRLRSRDAHAPRMRTADAARQLRVLLGIRCGRQDVAVALPAGGPDDVVR